jgi:hypothetical protein
MARLIHIIVDMIDSFNETTWLVLLNKPRSIKSNKRMSTTKDAKNIASLLIIISASGLVSKGNYSF